MKIEIPLTYEQEELLLLGMIEKGTLFMDISFPDYPSPLTALNLMFRDCFLNNTYYCHYPGKQKHERVTTL